MEPLLLKSKEGKEYDIGTMVYRIKLCGTDTGGLFSLLDFNIYPGAIGPGEHSHKLCSKTLFILSGRIRVKVGDDVKELSSGELIFIPKGVSHDYENPFDNPCRLLMYLSPAGLENFFEEAAEANSDEFQDLLEQYQIVMKK